MIIPRPASSSKFQSTHPLRGATRNGGNLIYSILFQSTHPLRGATPAPAQRDIQPRFQSTHPLRGATRLCMVYGMPTWISIHAPPAGCDKKILSRWIHLFISIHAPPAGCDLCVAQFGNLAQNFNPRTPCGVRRLSDCINKTILVFQSTHPLRGATFYIVRIRGKIPLISIHAPPAGCDRVDTLCF